jgi:hypothetical protein
MRFKMRWALALLPAIAVAMPAFAQAPRDPALADTNAPGSVIIFPKFINKPAVLTAGDAVLLPRTEIEVGSICPVGALCAEHQTVKIHFHWVCPGVDDVNTKFVCPETDFEIFVSVNGKLAFSANGQPINSNSPRVPAAPCANGYLIGYAVDNFDRPIKWDGLIGDAVLRGPSLPAGTIAPGFSTAVEAYKAITIQAGDSAATQGSLLTGDTALGELQFNGEAGGYKALTGKLYGDVKFDHRAPSSVGGVASGLNETWIVLLTLDVDSGNPNLPTFVDLDFWNESFRGVSTSNPDFEFHISAHNHFICWTQFELSDDLDANLTQDFMGTRKGSVAVTNARKVAFTGITNDETGPVTLIGLVQVFEGTQVGGYAERNYIFNMFNDLARVDTEFETINDE